MDRLWAPRPRFRQISQEDSIIDESTALPRALEGTKEVELSYYAVITLCQEFCDFSARSSGRSWKGARQAEGGFPEVPTSLQRPAGRPLQTLQKGHCVFRSSPNVGTIKAPHPVFFAIFPGCHTRANGHRFVGWRGEIMKGKGLL